MRFKTFLSIPLLLFCSLAVAQLSDDFQDGNLTDPDWQGQTDRFSVVNGELVLQDATTTSPSYLYLPASTSLQAATTWEFYVRTEFAPSANNHAIIYLSASNPDLSGDQFGYFLKVGGISGTDDALELFRQDGSSTSLVLSGMTGAAANDPVQARVRIIRSTDGSWQLFTDYSGGTNYNLEAAAIDATYDFGQYIGVLCKYTSSNATDNFFFDDFLIDPLYLDVVPPNLLSAVVTAPNDVQLQFDEVLDGTSAGLVTNYMLDQGIGNPSTAQLDGADPTRVNLTLSTALVIGQSYDLTVQNVADLAGNVLATQIISISYVIPEAYDVLINEIMASPPDGSVPGTLPAGVEYVELYNRSTKTLNLEGWT
ncbi:MAG: Ig-like domain-containing protein, partial [Phaeodactylibacter sp.]|nr:Ig-like domain-containing protein [Phaeodactylibacter sp.]